jgi:hypothetical protein
MRGALTELDVLIASPGDVPRERDAVEHAVHRWNDHWSAATGFILRPVRYEFASSPLSGFGDAQTIITSQIVDEADIIVAIFDSRLGTPTGRAESGTAEEIEHSIHSGKLVHVFFSNRKLPRSVDVKQLKALRAFQKKMNHEGLVDNFSSAEELKEKVLSVIENDVRIHRDVSDLEKQPPPPAEKPPTATQASAAEFLKSLYEPRPLPKSDFHNMIINKTRNDTRELTRESMSVTLWGLPVTYVIISDIYYNRNLPRSLPRALRSYEESPKLLGPAFSIKAAASTVSNGRRFDLPLIRKDEFRTDWTLRLRTDWTFRLPRQLLVTSLLRKKDLTLYLEIRVKPIRGPTVVLNARVSPDVE